MEKLFEIVSSFIPEEQKADIKASFDGEYEKSLGQHLTQTKKELSSKFRVNFFEEDLSKAFEDFVDKTVYKELETKYGNSLTELENLTKDKELLAETNTQLASKEGLFNSQLNLVSNGLRVDRLDLIKPHITGDVENDLKNIKESYPELFHGKQQKKQLFPESKNDSLTDAQRYFKRQTEKIKR